MDTCAACHAGQGHEGKELTHGICTHICSVNHFCGEGPSYRAVNPLELATYTDCTPCAVDVAGVFVQAKLDAAAAASTAAGLGAGAAATSAADADAQQRAQQLAPQLLAQQQRTAAGGGASSSSTLPATFEGLEVGDCALGSDLFRVCTTCREGGQDDGGVHLLDVRAQLGVSVCSFFCSPKGFCGFNMMYKKGVDCRPCGLRLRLAAKNTGGVTLPFAGAAVARNIQLQASQDAARQKVITEYEQQKAKLDAARAQAQAIALASSKQQLCTTEEGAAAHSWCITTVTPPSIAENTARLDRMCLADPPSSSSSSPPTAPSTAGAAAVPVAALLDWRIALDAARDRGLSPLSSSSSPPPPPPPGGEPSPTLGHGHIGGWNETMALFKAMVRCRRHFSVVRYGDGEVTLMRQLHYIGEVFAPGCVGQGTAATHAGSLGKKMNNCNHSKVPKWEFDPKAEAGPGAQRFIEMLYGGFELAAEQARFTIADVDSPLFDQPRPSPGGGDDNGGGDGDGGGSSKVAANPLFLGIPLFFCREGMTSLRPP